MAGLPAGSAPSIADAASRHLYKNITETSMHRVLVLGAGKIGALISGLLGESGDYRIDLADIDGDAVRSVTEAHGLDSVTGYALNAADPDELRAHVEAHPVDAVISGLPYFCNPAVAQVARDLGLHYFDLTEDVEVTDKVSQISEGASTAFAPQKVSFRDCSTIGRSPVSSNSLLKGPQF